MRLPDFKKINFPALALLKQLRVFRERDPEKFSPAPRRHWFIMLISSLLLVITAGILSGAEYLKIKNILRGTDAEKSAIKIPSLDLLALEKAIKEINHKKEGLEKILNSGATPIPDPALFPKRP